MAIHLMLFTLWLAGATVSASEALPGCPDSCGPVTIPYPFGIGDAGCYKDKQFEITCDTSFNPPKPFLGSPRAEVLDISTEGLVHINGPIASTCYTKSGWTNDSAMISFYQTSPYTLSDSHNKLTAIGCNAVAYAMGFIGANYTSGCMSLCGSNMSVINGSCNGIGCCQTSIPERQNILVVATLSTVEIGKCTSAFLVDPDRFEFLESDLSENKSFDRSAPVALDWVIGNETCEEAQKDSRSLACGNYSYCYNSENGAGYRCKCYDGFQGNPYLPNGCQDFDECADPETNPCFAICNNTPGSYCCSCPFGTTGDGRKNGTGCISIVAAAANKADFPVLSVTLGGGLGFLFLLIGSSWLYWGLNKRKRIQLKQKFFQQNGGLLLQQQIAGCEGTVETAKIFTAEELKRATHNFHESRILGAGGYGTVYKGILPDNKVVAIKKSKIVDESQIEQFINEVVVLSRINHKNVVKLLGCCLETQVPMLVYEFVTNGTLFHHIHDVNRGSSMSWENRLRIAAETASALSYLHSAASTPIIHRDIKSTNILLDDNYIAKVSDFGASRLVPTDKSQLTTLVQGTLGYLDPEYFHTGQFSEKSDVYSFGVVLVELLTGKMPICPERPEMERNLAIHFILSMKNERLFEVLEDRVVAEGGMEQLQSVAELANRCLQVAGEGRPTMKEVVMELEGLRRAENHPWIQQNNEEAENLLVVKMVT
ncbi:putative wall-associated receptor kinase-like protein 16 [Cinnamomum micranthum f. kanehirae]|uniref:Putative wall-associated receptor kinase-like protein 16 n=1 Tax=Cinnamomum micranthum f. kanehirae TaxID=337451 RepID=A0A443PVX5_9MAGN|nr:putative wall-associated receptor kinase-like protein 16 [Cinnamomum micranthum f. kanehirae]